MIELCSSITLLPSPPLTGSCSVILPITRLCQFLQLHHMRSYWKWKGNNTDWLLVPFQSHGATACRTRGDAAWIDGKKQSCSNIDVFQERQMIELLSTVRDYWQLTTYYTYTKHLVSHPSGLNAFYHHLKALRGHTCIPWCVITLCKANKTDTCSED